MLHTQRSVLYLALCFAILSAIFLGVAMTQTDSAPEPVTKARILRGLKIGTEQSFIATRVSEQGVDFTLTPEIEKELKNAGANEELIGDIRKAKVTLKQTASSLVIDTDADCTVAVNGTSFAMKAGESRKIAGDTGDNVVKAVSKKDATATWRQVVQLQAGEQKAVLIELQGQGGSTTTDTLTQDQGSNRNGGRAGQTKVNSKDGLTYVWIAPGTFQMGCSTGDSECDGDEKPAHSVTITKGFWIGQTAVTQAAYQRVAGKNPSYFQGDQLPVEQVTWDEASSYCTAVGMRLPTEAEWEYAARAGSTASRYGDIDAVAWYADNSGNAHIDSTAMWKNDWSNYLNKLKANGNQTHPVGQKQPNAWKLYDMLGNVWQWTADWYGDSYYAPSPSQNPQGPTSGQYRTLRGGSWNSNPRDVRVSFRSRNEPGNRSDVIGFRCVGD